LFHGNNALGSDQRAAVALRQALLHAGFVVLSVDHPGYGASPPPQDLLELTAWDSLATSQAALEFLRQQDGIERIVLIGHSMGCKDVLRMLAAGVRVDSAVIFGAGLMDGSDRDQYWYERFHRDRRLVERLPPELVVSIRQEYYNNELLARGMPADHPTVYFVRFGHEHDNIKATRDELFELIPGSKVLVDYDATHYFNTYESAGLVLLDTRATRSAGRLLRSIHEPLPEPAAGGDSPGDTPSVPNSAQPEGENLVDRTGQTRPDSEGTPADLEFKLN
jgi:pimeloyl-ACP methyl ester carboxylesterase